MRVIAWVITFFSVFQASLAASASAAPSCEDRAKSNPIYRAFDLCDQIRAAKQPEIAAHLASQLEKLGYCTTMGENSPSSRTLGKICSDPATYVCRENGNYMNSQCQFQLESPRDVVFNPDYVAQSCKISSQVQALLDSHRAECSAGQSASACDSHLRIQYRKDLLQIERDTIYDQPTKEKLSQLFDRVKTTYLQLIRESTRIPAARKQILLDRLQATDLALPTDPDQDSDCFNSSTGGPSSAIENDGNRGPHPKIFFCIGAVAMFNRMNIYDIIHTLGHELTHSIDPCALEELSVRVGKIDPSIVADTFPGVESCLRGSDDCSKSVLHCNSPKGIKQYCDGDEDCMSAVQKTPHCDIGPDDTKEKADDLSDYRKLREPIQQINESFADFYGAEVTARILQEDKSMGKLDEAGQVDALTAISSDYARIHGRCLYKNTNDEHPSGVIRVDRIIMGSKSFRETICDPGTKPPVQPFAGASCEGF